MIHLGTKKVLIFEMQAKGKMKNDQQSYNIMKGER